MSLYALQKAIYEVNRDQAVLARYRADAAAFAEGYGLDEEERNALVKPDIGLLYVLGVNGQLLMHFAATCGVDWDAYILAMQEGVRIYGPVRDGLYAIKGSAR